MEQNSADSHATRRSAEIHSDKAERGRVSSAQAARKASCFAEYRLLQITNSLFIWKKTKNERMFARGMV